MWMDRISTQPVFFLFIAATFMLAAGYFWGRRKNREIYYSALKDLTEIIDPVDQTFTNIGGAIGFHATLTPKRDSFLANAEITITLLPRQAWLYFPISWLIRKSDRLFISLNLKRSPPAEGHLIEYWYATFRGPQITNAKRMKKEDVTWGDAHFILYSTNANSRNHLLNLVKRKECPGSLRHIAFVPNQKRCFVVMIPETRNVANHFGPVYEWLPSTMNRD